MISSFFSLRAALASMVMLFCLFGASTSVQADNTAVAQEARSFVVALADRTIGSLTEKEIDKKERRNRFRALMLEYFAFKSIAKWVLGRYWRRANEAQRKEFMMLFEDLLVVVYADRFAKYSGLRLDVGKSEIRGANDILVHSILKRSKGVKSVGVIWRVRRINFDLFCASIGLTLLAIVLLIPDSPGWFGPIERQAQTNRSGMGNWPANTPPPPVRAPVRRQGQSTDPPEKQNCHRGDAKPPAEPRVPWK